MTLYPVLVSIPSSGVIERAADFSPRGVTETDNADQPTEEPRGLKPAARKTEPQGLTGPQRVRRQRYFARLALRFCAKLCGVPLDGWRQDAGDVPLPNEGYYWSIAHKPSMAVAVIADQPIGIDIERIKPRGRAHFDETGSAKEWALLGDQTDQAFFRLWTAKEAVLKTVGVGMAGWDRCTITEVTDDGRLKLIFQGEGQPFLVEHFFHAGHLAAVTCPPRARAAASVSRQVSWQVPAIEDLIRVAGKPPANHADR